MSDDAKLPRGDDPPPTPEHDHGEHDDHAETDDALRPSDFTPDDGKPFSGRRP